MKNTNVINSQNKILFVISIKNPPQPMLTRPKWVFTHKILTI